MKTASHLALFNVEDVIMDPSTCSLATSTGRKILHLLPARILECACETVMNERIQIIVRDAEADAPQCLVNPQVESRQFFDFRLVFCDRTLILLLELRNKSKKIWNLVGFSIFGKMSSKNEFIVWIQICIKIRTASPLALFNVENLATSTRRKLPQVNNLWQPFGS